MSAVTDQPALTDDPATVDDLIRAAGQAFVAAFAAQFEPTGGRVGIDTPEAQEQAAATTGMVDSDVTLPETDISRPEEG